MKKIRIFCLFTALLIILFQHFYYLCELYYDRDIAGYAYNALCLSEGKGWYYNIWDAKPPAINLIILGAFSLFGQSVKSIYFAALFFNLLSLSFIYLFAKLILSKETKLYFLLPVFFSLFFTSGLFKAYSANTEVFLAVFEIAGILFLGLNRYFISGALLGVGFLIRQTGIYTFFAGALIIIAINFLDKQPLKTLIKNSLSFISAFILPLLIVSLYFFSQGLLDQFLKYTFIDNLKHLNEYVISIHKRDLLITKLILWKEFKFELISLALFSLAGLGYILTHRTKITLSIFLWAIVICFGLSISAIYPHHFIQIAAPIACISVLGISFILKSIKSLLKNILLQNIIVFILIAILVIPHICSIASFITIKRPIHYAQGAKERFLAAQYINKHTSSKDKIFVWDNFDGGAIYLWSKRQRIGKNFSKRDFLPLKLIEYWQPSLADYKLNQKQLLLDLRAHRPKYIIIVTDFSSHVNNLGNVKVERKNLAAEKNAFPEFFELLDKDCAIEKRIGAEFPILICRYKK